MAARKNSEVIRSFILRTADEHPRDVGIIAAKEFGISRQAVSRHLKVLIEQGFLTTTGKTSAKEYRTRILDEAQKQVKEPLSESAQEDILKRYWCKRDGSYHVTPHGYPSEPELDSEWGSIFYKDITDLSLSHDSRCLALIGEPGIGKTTTIKNYFDEARKVRRGNNELIVYQDAGLLHGEYGFYRFLTGNKNIIEWLDSGSNLHLAIDNFDELLVAAPRASDILLSQLERWRIEHLSLRIASRTSSWPQFLETELCSLFGDNEFEVLELLPLTYSAIASYVKSKIPPKVVV